MQAACLSVRLSVRHTLALTQIGNRTGLSIGTNFDDIE